MTNGTTSTTTRTRVARAERTWRPRPIPTVAPAGRPGDRDPRSQSGQAQGHCALLVARRRSRLVQRHQLSGRPNAFPTGDLARKAEPLDGGGGLVLAPVRLRKHPHHLELVAVGVPAVEALGGAVARLTGECAEPLQG